MARLPIDFHPEARLEADAAFEHYRERSTKAAERFYLELERASTAIQNAPESWAAYLRGTRRYLLKRFPFVVVYRATENRIEIIAVAHGHRRPGYWADRLT
jgi:toxin ParE1/3/4